MSEIKMFVECTELLSYKFQQTNIRLIVELNSFCSQSKLSKYVSLKKLGNPLNKNCEINSLACFLKFDARVCYSFNQKWPRGLIPTILLSST